MKGSMLKHTRKVYSRKRSEPSEPSRCSGITAIKKAKEIPRFDALNKPVELLQRRAVSRMVV